MERDLTDNPQRDSLVRSENVKKRSKGWHEIEKERCWEMKKNLEILYPLTNIKENNQCSHFLECCVSEHFSV
jgi:hypothetical protein